MYRCSITICGMMHTASRYSENDQKYYAKAEANSDVEDEIVRLAVEKQGKDGSGRIAQRTTLYVSPFLS